MSLHAFHQSDNNSNKGKLLQSGLYWPQPFPFLQRHIVPDMHSCTEDGKSMKLPQKTLDMQSLKVLLLSYRIRGKEVPVVFLYELAGYTTESEVQNREINTCTKVLISS